MSFTTVTVTGTFLVQPTIPAQGSVTFQLSETIANGPDMYSFVPIVVQLDNTGSFSVSLVALDDAGTTPANAMWNVIVQLDSLPGLPQAMPDIFAVSLTTANAPTVELGSLSRLTPNFPGGLDA